MAAQVPATSKNENKPPSLGYDATEEIKECLGLSTNKNKNNNSNSVESSANKPQNISNKNNSRRRPLKNNQGAAATYGPSNTTDNMKQFQNPGKFPPYQNKSNKQMRNHSPVERNNKSHTNVKSTKQKEMDQNRQRVNSNRHASNNSRLNAEQKKENKSNPQFTSVPSSTPVSVKNSKGVNAMTSAAAASLPAAPDTMTEDYVTEEMLAVLEKDLVFSLKKKSIKFPNAKYFCRLCEYHCDTYEISKKHIKDKRHSELAQIRSSDITLKYLPEPCKPQIKVLNELIERVAKENMLSENDIKERKKLIAQFETDIKELVPEVKLEVSGSMLSGFALKTSDINLDLVLPEGVNVSVGLLATKKLVETNAFYVDVNDELSSRYPYICFRTKNSDVRIKIGASSNHGRSTNKLYADYASIDPRVKTLGIAFRHWAKTCKIDDQLSGTLPSYSFILMLIHFLQQIPNPVLPVLHELSDSDDYCDPSKLEGKWKCENELSIGQLWLELFKYYSIDQKQNNHIIDIKRLQPMLPGTGKASNKQMSLKDPYQSKRNIARTISNNIVLQYIQECFRISAKYFLVPQMSFGPLYLQIDQPEALKLNKTMNEPFIKPKPMNKALGSDDSSYSEEDEDDDEEDTLYSSDDNQEEYEDSVRDIERNIAQMSIVTENKRGARSKPNSVSESTTDSDGKSCKDGKNDDQIHMNIDDVKKPLENVTCSLAIYLSLQVKREFLHYSFQPDNFNNGKQVPIYCLSCQAQGHVKRDCTSNDLPPVMPLPPLTNEFDENLNKSFLILKSDIEPQREEIRERDRIVNNLQTYIKQFYPEASLCLFGSSANGFGFQGSDLDICLTFQGNKYGENIDHISVITYVAEKLKKYRECYDVMPITTAKVPIVKFTMKKCNIEGDLSLYNILAIENTKLLATYANIDPRVKILGYVMKYFAKICDIGDASRGSLSSYAYTLMVIHFLQQVKPPVIPVLQELYDHSKPQPENKIDMWNAWFYSDIDKLPNVWKDYGKNKMSVGTLCVKLFCYYTEGFNWKDNVITIKQSAPLTRLEKMWTTRCIAIEDPFDLSHNLGAGLSRRMNTFIMKSFIKGRENFGVSLSVLPTGYPNLIHYLFDRDRLQDEAPPNDRGCRMCGRIGHFVKDCPRKKQHERNRARRKEDHYHQANANQNNFTRENEKYRLNPGAAMNGTQNQNRRNPNRPVRGMHQNNNDVMPPHQQPHPQQVYQNLHSYNNKNYENNPAPVSNNQSNRQKVNPLPGYNGPVNTNASKPTIQPQGHYNSQQSNDGSTRYNRQSGNSQIPEPVVLTEANKVKPIGYSSGNQNLSSNYIYSSNSNSLPQSVIHPNNTLPPNMKPPHPVQNKDLDLKTNPPAQNHSISPTALFNMVNKIGARTVSAPLPIRFNGPIPGNFYNNNSMISQGNSPSSSSIDHGNIRMNQNPSNGSVPPPPGFTTHGESQNKLMISSQGSGTAPPPGFAEANNGMRYRPVGSNIMYLLPSNNKVGMEPNSSYQNPPNMPPYQQMQMIPNSKQNSQSILSHPSRTHESVMTNLQNSSVPPQGLSNMPAVYPIQQPQAGLQFAQMNPASQLKFGDITMNHHSTSSVTQEHALPNDMRRFMPTQPHFTQTINSSLSQSVPTIPQGMPPPPGIVSSLPQVNLGQSLPQAMPMGPGSLHFQSSPYTQQGLPTMQQQQQDLAAILQIPYKN